MTMKERVRLVIAGKATYRRVRPDRGGGGPYGQDRRPARWACIDCGRIVDGTDDRPMPHRTTWWDGQGQWDDPCARNGHAPCWACGKPLPRLNDGCPREHVWTLVRQLDGATTERDEARAEVERLRDGAATLAAEWEAEIAAEFTLAASDLRDMVADPSPRQSLAMAVVTLRTERDTLRAERDAHRKRAERAEAALARVRELHMESRSSMSALYPNPLCECGKDYPCPTIAAIGGES